MDIKFNHDESMVMVSVVLDLLKVLLSKMEQDPTTPYGFDASFSRFAGETILHIHNSNNNACVNITTRCKHSDEYEITYGDYNDFDRISLTSKKTAKTVFFDLDAIFNMTRFIRDWLTRNTLGDENIDVANYRY